VKIRLQEMPSVGLSHGVATVTLTFSDEQHLEAARGWLGLGDFLSANEELDNITPRHRAHPHVLRERLRVFAAGKRWKDAGIVGEFILPVFEGDPEFRYLLAQVATQANQLKLASRHLEAAFLCPEGRELKLRALEDPLLAPVWGVAGDK
jgi:hypothetical protein